MAVVQAGSWSSGLTPSLGTSRCHRCSPKKWGKKKTTMKYHYISPHHILYVPLSMIFSLILTWKAQHCSYLKCAHSQASCQPVSVCFYHLSCKELIAGFYFSIWGVTSLVVKKITSNLSFSFYFQTLHLSLLIFFLSFLLLKHDAFRLPFK